MIGDIFSGSKRPKQGEGSKYYIEVTCSKEEIKYMHLEQNQYFKNAAEDEYSVYYESEYSAFMSYKEFTNECERADYNEDAVFRCQIAGKKNHSVKCMKNCSECEYRPLKKQSLNTEVAGDTNEPVEFGDLIVDKSVDVEGDAIRKMDMEKLMKILSEYTPEEVEILLSKFQNVSQNQVLDKLGIARSTGRDKCEKLFREVQQKMLFPGKIKK